MLTPKTLALKDLDANNDGTYKRVQKLIYI
jgi:hypothetical protein